MSTIDLFQVAQELYPYRYKGGSVKGMGVVGVPFDKI